MNYKTSFITIPKYVSIQQIRWDSTNTFLFGCNPSNDYWMTFPKARYLIAFKYNVMLIFISQIQCLTFFPLISTPLPQPSQKIITIGFINNSHFIQVFFFRLFVNNYYFIPRPSKKGKKEIFLTIVNHDFFNILLFYCRYS